jgi:hypothetical protein
MKRPAMTLMVLLASPTFASAQGNPSGPGSVTGDPAASSANPNSDPSKTTGQSNSPAVAVRPAQVARMTTATKAGTKCRRATWL